MQQAPRKYQDRSNEETSHLRQGFPDGLIEAVAHGRCFRNTMVQGLHDQIPVGPSTPNGDGHVFSHERGMMHASSDVLFHGHSILSIDKQGKQWLRDDADDKELGDLCIHGANGICSPVVDGMEDRWLPQHRSAMGLPIDHAMLQLSEQTWLHHHLCVDLRKNPVANLWTAPLLG